MNQHRNSNVLAFGLALVAGAFLGAQQPAALPHGGEGVDLQRVASASFGMDFVDGALRAAGPRYKAEFRADGVEYTPALGKDATRNHPLVFTLESIRRGAATLYDAAADGSAAPQQSGLVASYERGSGITETYEARVDGLKQNFTFAQLPAGRGDLVVTGRIATDLVTGQSGVQDAGLAFTAEGIGGVSIGSVVGFDAHGARSAGGIRLDGDRVQFSLPSSFVEQAAYPMTLDPMLGTLLQVDLDAAQDPDVAWDESFDQYLVVWELVFSALDIDVYGQKFDLDGNLVATTIFVATSLGSEINPSVANVDAGSDFFVAFQSSASPLGPYDIRGRRVDGGSGTAQSSAFDVASGLGNETSPDCGGDNSQVNGVNDGVIVVYDDSTGISAVKVDVSLAQVVVGPVTVNASANSKNPAISKSGGLDGRHVIVWEQQFLGGRNVQAALVDRDLNFLDSLTTIGSTAADEFNPDVDGDGTTFLVAYQVHENGESGPSDVHVRRALWNGMSLVTPSAAEPVSAVAATDERDPAIGNLGAKYVIACGYEVGPLNYDIATIEIDPATCLACGQVQVSSGNASPFVDINPEIATRWQGRYSNEVGALDQGIVVWMDARNTPPFGSDVVAQRYEAFGGGVSLDLGGGCGNGGTNSFRGPISIGNSSFALRVTGAGTDLLLVSVQPTQLTLNCGGCVINADTASYLFVPGTSGNAELPIPLPCNSTLVGIEIYTQWAGLLSGANPCVIIPASLDISFSNRMYGQVGY